VTGRSGAGDPDAHEAVRRSYDEVAELYQAAIGGELAHKPLDRAILAAIVEETGKGALIADIGCGPGHVTAWLADLGAHPVGIDISNSMLNLARREHPGLEFREGDLVALPAADGEFAAAVALYSVIHLAPDELPRAFAELHRVLAPSALLLVSFHVGTELRHLSEWWGREVDLDFFFFETERVAEALEGAGFSIWASLDRKNYPEEVETRRAYLFSRRA